MSINQVFPSKILCLTVPKFFVRETFSVSLFPRTEKVRIKEGGASRFSVGTLLSHGAEKFPSGESFTVSLVSGIEKIYASESYVTIFDFLSNFFCLTVPKNLVGDPFCAVFQKKSSIEKIFG